MSTVVVAETRLAEQPVDSSDHPTQFELALRRVRERDCAVDPEAAVGAFQSAF